MNDGLRRQIGRLEASGYLKTPLLTVAEKCLNELKARGKTRGSSALHPQHLAEAQKDRIKTRRPCSVIHPT